MWLVKKMLLGLVLVGSVATPVMATVDLSKAFQTNDSSIVPGSLVSVQKNKAGSIELANTTNADRLVGVAVEPANTLLAMEAAGSNIQVAISGTVNVLVSTLGGDIKAGDQVSISPLSGVGIAGQPGLRIIGIAQADFSGRSAGSQLQTITDKNQHKQRVYIGTIPVVIGIGYAQQTTNEAPGFLQGAQVLAIVAVGHSVSTLRVALSLVIVIVSLSALAGLIYGAVHGSLLSIGRNPLARGAVYRSLLAVAVMAAGLVGLTAMVLYFTLR